MKRAHTKTEPAFSTMARNLNTRKLLNVAAICSCLGILGLASAILASSDLSSDSYAVDGASLNSKVTATVDGTYWVSLTASDAAFTVSPTDGAATDKQTVNVEVETNATGGAKLYLSTANDTNALFKDGDITSSAANVAAAAGTTSLAGLANNTWAYSTDDANYQGVPTQGSEALLATVDGTTTGTTSGGVISDTVPVYYAAKIDSSLPAGTYSNSVVYSAVVDGGIVTSAELTSITIDGTATNPAEMWVNKENVILVTTNLKTNTYGTPRVYYTGTTSNTTGGSSSTFYSECSNVIVGSNSDGYMTVTCTTTPTTEATNVTLHIVPKGEPTTGSAANNNLTGDPFCTDGTYNQDTSECEAGEWKWGSFTVSLPDITPPPTLMSEISTMQEMTPEFCASVTDKAPYNTARLKDTRDGKYYWVAKLKDGNCWMTQNLDLNLDGRTLTPADSDVSSNWTFNGSWYNSADQGSTSYSAIQGWDLGEYVKTSPTATTSCTSYSDLSECTSQFTQVTSSMTPYTEAVNEGKLPAENVAVSGNNYDAHYLVGNYYSFEAATAGSAPSGEGDAPDSICSAGWQLPRYTNGSWSNADYYNLLVEYGLNDSNPDGALNTAPLYFVRSGYVSPSNRYLDVAGSIGYYWYGRAISSFYGCFLGFSSTNVSPTYSYGYRYYGLSVRCIAPSA